MKSIFLDRISEFIPGIQDQSMILMMHRVGRRDLSRIPANQNMIVSPEELNLFIIDSKKRGWSFISLDELLELVIDNCPIKKKLLITFDDGYLDNFTEAAPVLISNNVPFTVYITTGFIESEKVPWWYMLESIIDKYSEIKIPSGLNLELRSIKSKQSAFLLIRSKLMSSNSESLIYLNWISEIYSSCSIEYNQLFMNWRDLEELASYPLATIGAHTHTHPVLANLKADELREEICLSKKILEDRLSKTIRHFAYPFGGNSQASDREYQLIKDLDFDTAVTACMGVINSSKVNLHALPRCFYAPSQTLESLQSRLLKNILKNQLKKVMGFD